MIQLSLELCRVDQGTVFIIPYHVYIQFSNSLKNFHFSSESATSDAVFSSFPTFFQSILKFFLRCKTMSTSSQILPWYRETGCHFEFFDSNTILILLKNTILILLTLLQYCFNSTTSISGTHFFKYDFELK